jgi:thymidylate synthase (FAD)
MQQQADAQVAEKTVQVLDKGFVRYIAHMGSDLMVVNAARVSFAKEVKEITDRDVKLIDYLARHNHWTPFAHPQVSIHIKSPIAIRAQLGKHQVGLVMNEVSRRYVKDAPEVYNPRWRSAPTDGAKQGSSGFITGATYANQFYEESVEDSMEAYQELLSDGVAPEQARFVLPQGTYTEWWWTGSLSAFARVCKLRKDPHSQWESQEYAKAIEAIIQPLFPVSWKALMVDSN